jgi:ribonuclease BN (tRNA processing enzyme)
VEETIALAGNAGVGVLVLFHHSPVRTDGQLDRILEVADSPVPVVVAQEGMRIPVSPRKPGPARAPRRSSGSLPSGS